MSSLSYSEGLLCWDDLGESWSVTQLYPPMPEESDVKPGQIGVRFIHCNANTMTPVEVVDPMYTTISPALGTRITDR